MNNDITALIRRSNELSKALAQRSLTHEEVQWGVKIALAGLPENDLIRSRWSRLRARIFRLARST